MGKYQPFLDLPAAQFAGLVADIEKRGVLLPILVDEDDKTIDGHQRRRAAAEAGVECPKVVVEGLSEDEKQTLALTLNLFRRHLSGVERSKALQQLAQLGLSTRRMADILGVSKSTVHRDLGELSQAGQLDRPERVEGADGKSRPATMPERPPVNVDADGVILADTATSGSDQSGGVLPDAAGPGDDEQDAPPASSPAPKVAPPETAEARAAREAEEARRDRNVYFGKHLIGLWSLLGDGDKPTDDLIAGWVPEECPAWLVEPTRFVFTPDGLRDLARMVEKLAAKWEAAGV